MNKLKKLKPILVAIVALMLATSSIISVFLYQISAETKKVIIRNESGENVINRITVGETSRYLEYYADLYDLKLDDHDDEDSSNDELILRENDSIEFETSVLHSVFVSFNKDESDGEILIQEDNIQTKYDLSDDSNEQTYFKQASIVSLLKDHVNHFSGAEKTGYILGIVAISILFYFAIIQLLKIFFKIKKEKRISVPQFLLIFIAYTIVNIVCMLPVMEIIYRWYFIVIVFQLAFILYYFKDILKDNLHIVFTLFATILCVNMAILLLPFHVPDEFSHYIKAASVFDSENVLMVDNKPRYELSSEDYNISTKYTFALHDANYKTSFREYYVDMTTNIDSDERLSVGFANTYYLNSFAYLPDALVIKLASFMNSPITLTALLCRVMNAFIFIICGYFALKIIPCFKKLYFLMLLFPITIQQVSGICQDSLTLSVLFLLIAVILNQAYGSERKVSKKSITLILILSIFLGMCKPGYFLFLGLMWLIPNEKFSSKKIAILFKLLPLVLCIGLTFAKYLTTTTIGTTIEDGMTIKYALSHPLTIVKICLSTIYQRLSLDLITGQLNLFGWSTIFYDYLFSYIIYFIYTLLVFFDNKEKNVLSVRDRIIMIAIAVLSWGIIYASAMFSFNMTTIHSTIVAGLQSRYFIPMTILFAFALSNNLVKINIKRKEMLYAIVVIVTFGVSFFTIINGFYL